MFFKCSVMSVGTLFVALIVGCGGIQPVINSLEQVKKKKIDSDNRVYLPIKLNGKPYFFLLDTGASGNVVDDSISLPENDYLKRQLVGSVFDPVYAKSYTLQTLSIGELPLPPDIAYVMNISDSRHQNEYHGILGMGSLDRQRIYIPFKSNHLFFLDNIPVSLIEGSAEYELGLDAAGRPTIELSLVSGLRTVFVLDTGAQTSSLSPDAFDLLVKLTGSRVVDSIFSGVSGAYKTRITWLDRFDFAGHEHQDLTISKSSSSLLGMDILSAYSMVIDLKENTLYLKAR